MKVLARNRKALHIYSVIERLEAGIALAGTEVKSLRGGKVNFADSFASLENNELFLRNLDIQPYSHGNIFNHAPKRARKLLVHRSEIGKLGTAMDQKGLALVPLSLYLNKTGKIKVELGICRGKKEYDKREDLRKRDAKRAISRALASL